MVSLEHNLQSEFVGPRRNNGQFVGLLCFFSSGACGLIYEVVWSRFFALYVGNTANSHTIVITSFMGGLALGYYLFGNVAGRLQSGLRAYAVVEWLISAYALAFVFLYPVVADVVLDWVRPFGPGATETTAARWGLAVLSLVPPTLLMGGTLPLLVHQFHPTVGKPGQGTHGAGDSGSDHTRSTLRHVLNITRFFRKQTGAKFDIPAQLEPVSQAQTAASLYGWNSAGAVVGCLSSGLVWIPLFGIANTMIWASIVNAVVASIAWVASRRRHDSVGALSEQCDSHHSPRRPEVAGTHPTAGGGVVHPPSSAAHVLADETGAETSRPGSAVPIDTPYRSRFAARLLVVAFLSGLLSFTLQSIWIRLFSLILGSSTYSFTIVIAACILGITLGSWAIHRWIQRYELSLKLLAVLFATVCVVLWSQSWLYQQLPWLFAHVRLVLPPTAEAFPLYLGAQVCVVGLVVMIPVGILAMMLPIVIGLVGRFSPNAPKTIGVAFAVNSVGCVLAASLATPFLIPTLGVHGLFVAITAICGFACIVICGFCHGTGGHRNWAGIGGALVLTLVVILVQARWDVQIFNAGEFRTKRSQIPDLERFRKILQRGEVLFHEDAPEATVIVVGKGEHRVLRVNGKADASTGGDMITQVASAHIPLLFSPNPQQVLIVGLGSGVTAGSAAIHDVDVDVVEISPAVIRASRFFEHVNHTNSRRVSIIEEDAKAFLRLSDKRYDVIISEPSNPWIAGTASLFSVEFFEELKRHLNDGGIVAQWLHLYEISDSQVEMILATLATSFPHFTVWELFPNDLIVLAGTAPLDFDLPRLKQRFEQPDVASDLARVGIVGIPALLSLQVLSEASAQRLGPWRVKLNRDLHPRLEFLAPIGLFRGDRATLFDDRDDRRSLRVTDTDLLVGRWARDHGVKNADWENVFRLHTRFPGSPIEFRLGLVEGFLAHSGVNFLVALLHTLIRERHVNEAEKVAGHLLEKYPTNPEVLYPNALLESVRMAHQGTNDTSKLIDLLRRCVAHGDDRLNRCTPWLESLGFN